MSYFFKRLGKIYRLKRLAVVKRPLADLRYRIGETYFRKRCTIYESPLLNDRIFPGDNHTFKGGGAIKGIFFKIPDCIRKGNLFKVFFIVKAALAHSGNVAVFHT